jgi:hypothetical protein
MLECSAYPANYRQLPASSCQRYLIFIGDSEEPDHVLTGVGLQSTMMLLWSFAGIPLGVYTIAQDLNIALQIQPQLLTALSLITWGQCLYYKKVCEVNSLRTEEIWY